MRLVEAPDQTEWANGPAARFLHGEDGLHPRPSGGELSLAVRPRRYLVPAPERRLPGLRLRQPLARLEPPVVDRQAQRASRPPQPDGPRPRRGHPAACLRRRAGPPKTRARALRREIPGRPHIPPLAAAVSEHAP